MRQYARFDELPLKCEFSRNGNLWVKHSTRTARIVGYGNLVFYFSRRELCTVGAYSRLAGDYFGGK